MINYFLQNLYKESNLCYTSSEIREDWANRLNSKEKQNKWKKEQ